MLHIHIQITGIPKIVMALVMAVVVYLFGAKGVHFNFTFFIEAYKRKSIHQHQCMFLCLYINFRIFASVYMCIHLTIMCSLYVCERVKGINKK